MSDTTKRSISSLGTDSETGVPITIPYAELRALTKAILMRGLGYSDAEAEITAEVLVEADARGIPSHGVSRLAMYRKNTLTGHAVPGAQPEIVLQTPCSLVVDGHGGIGAYISQWSVDKMLDMAETAGTAFCSVRNSNHYGIAGWWAEKAARRGMIGMAFTNTIVAGVPTFGKRRLLGTNPIAVAIPEAGGRMFLLDMATTTTAHGKVEVYARRNKAMPLGWMVDEEGRGTTDAAATEDTFYNTTLGGHLYLGGEGEDLGGHKGYGLGLLVELLCAGLSLGTTSYDSFRPGREADGLSHFFGALRMDIFGDPDALKAHIGRILETIRKAEKAAGRDRIYVHGEKEAEARAASLQNGVFVDTPTIRYLESLIEEYGLDDLRGTLERLCG